MSLVPLTRDLFLGLKYGDSIFFCDPRSNQYIPGVVERAPNQELDGSSPHTFVSKVGSGYERTHFFYFGSADGLAHQQ